MQRLILMVLLCLPLSVFSQEQIHLQEKNEIGLQLNATDFLGTNVLLNYTRHINDRFSLQLEAGGSRGSNINTYLASFGFRRILFKHKNFQIHTGMDLSYQHSNYAFDIPPNIRPFRIQHQFHLDIPIQLSYHITKDIKINTTLKQGISIYDKYNGFGGNSISRRMFNIGISKKF